MDELKAIKYFNKVAETGSFSQSADFFGVPASSLSRRIADLEKKLQATLLQRTTRSVHLTEIGKTYYQHTQAVLSQLNLASDVVTNYQKQPQGELRISSMTIFGELFLLPLLEKFKQQYPDIVLNIYLSDELSDLNENDVDIAIRGGYVPNERIIAKKISSNEFVAMASPEYLAQYGIPKTALALKNHQGIYYRTPQGVTPWLTQIDGQWHNVSAPAVTISNNYNWLLDNLLTGKGIGFLPQWTVQNYLDTGELQILDINPKVTISTQGELGVYLLYQKHHYQIPKIKVAVDFLLSHLKFSE
ncbi:D-malate degradation protein R [Phocoenobacter uteri]|uniref:D-malate degradation protein R n=1 Tax=Phocoenobacter uteri TaxID=146806 RepID=A0A379C946_9PAST|nr:LysR family transcriptional regulator [Phocoenobacter uteri]MDG6882526.1 LysR family transcriptional regulator [Phocoenobacter uteri]SUB58689.1 D-malate degradation protein R [Phocoenobacter uteri]